MASAAETARDWDMALEMYTDMLEWEEESKKEDIYQKLVKIQGEKRLKKIRHLKYAGKERKN